MSRYLITRMLDDLDEHEQGQIGLQARRLILEDYPEITWEHSHVVTDSAGNLRSFCVYDAPSEDVIRAHGDRLEHTSIETIYEIGGDISPADFPV